MLELSAQGLYRKSPRWLRELALSAYGLVLDRRRFGSDFPGLLAEAEALSFAPPSEICAYRERQWNERVKPALARVAAYGRASIELRDLERLPILTKAIVRDDVSRFTQRLPRHTVVRAHTSGTTGAGLRFTSTWYAHRRQWAWWWRYRRWHGITLGEWCGVFGGRAIVPSFQARPPFWHVNYAARTVLFSQYHLTPDSARLYLDEIRRRGLKWLHGYPSLLALLARAGLDAGLSGSVALKWITVGAENLLSTQREVIRRMFGIEPRQHYGTAEGVANISECPDGALHIDEDYSIVELVPIDGVAGAFRIVGSTLDNSAFPLIRYDVGDVVRVGANSPCGCGRAGRIIESIDGRQEDFLILSDGALVGRVDHFFKDAVNVREAQIVQNTAGEAVFRIVRNPAYRVSDEVALRKAVSERVADRLRLSFSYVDSIERTASGKLRFVISSIARAKITAPE